MKSYHNLEKSAFQRGDYVGYAHGAWRIQKCAGYWWASHLNKQYPSFDCKTLRDVSERLETINS